ncbi:hypothetical protein E4U59_004764 [Claviceps monticola]|nr:hypothetical protein E4U59_004764 [Claviceps monticola]
MEPSGFVIRLKVYHRYVMMDITIKALLKALQRAERHPCLKGQLAEPHEKHAMDGGEWCPSSGNRA